MPFLGSGPGVFRPWVKHLPAWIEAYALQLPGREMRLRETPIRSWDALLPQLAEAATALGSLPLSLYGHSMGAVIALDLARALAARKSVSLRLLACGGHRWPGAPGGNYQWLAECDGEVLIERLTARYGARNEALADPAVKALLLPALMGDAALLADYTYRKAKPMSCPLLVLHGRDDPATVDHDPALWARETTGGFSVTEIEGGHYFLESHARASIDALVQKLAT
ncbi:MAG: alpha/beta fold hydrolase [Pseudomonadota bacterium]